MKQRCARCERIEDDEELTPIFLYPDGVCQSCKDDQVPNKTNK